MSRVLALATLLCSGVAAADVFKNLQVMPKTSSREELKQEMRMQSKSLGVECDFCHDMPDMASDKSSHKATARAMMRMTEELNTKWFKDAKKQVNCGTCHQGHEEPPRFPPMAAAAPAVATPTKDASKP
jgi:hypothetical protein